MARCCRILLALVLLVVPAAGPSVADVLSDVPYLGDAGAAPSESQSLDLFLPAPDPVAPPLVAFVHSRFWSQRDGARSLVANFARPLQRAGVAVAIVRHRLAPEYTHPDQVRDVAAALAFLLQNAGRYGYDPARVFVAGHSSGAQLATLVALDGRYLSEFGASPGDLAGVIAVSGVFDLTDGENTSAEEQRFVARAFPSEEQRREASPLHHVRADAPPFLVIAAGDDIPSVLPESKAFTEAMRAAGHQRTEGLHIGGVDHFSILDFRDPRSAARSGVLALVNPPAPSD